MEGSLGQGAYSSAGAAIRREVLGDAHVDRSLADAEANATDILQEWVTEAIWGRIWSRSGLARRDRSLLNIGILTATGQHHELAVHLRGALTNGLSRTEIVEAVLQSAAYSGAPRGLAAMRVVQEVFEAVNEPASGEQEL